jgi:hypothetical protein
MEPFSRAAVMCFLGGGTSSYVAAIQNFVGDEIEVNLCPTVIIGHCVYPGC